MLPIDDTDWLEDFRIKEDCKEALEVAADDEEAAEARRGLAGLS